MPWVQKACPALRWVLEQCWLHSLISWDPLQVPTRLHLPEQGPVTHSPGCASPMKEEDRGRREEHGADETCTWGHA